MSHTATTQQIPQWAQDAEGEISATGYQQGLIAAIIARHAPKQRGLLAKDANREYLGRIRALLDVNDAQQNENRIIRDESSRLSSKLLAVTNAAVAVLESTRGSDGVEMPPTLGSLEKLANAVVGIGQTESEAQARIAELEAENARLREALEHIVSIGRTMASEPERFYAHAWGCAGTALMPK